MSDIKTGFTGQLEDKTGITATVKRASAAVQRETGTVAATVQDHRVATGSVLLVVGAVAFFAGYLLGSGERDDGVSSWFRR